MHSIFFYFDKNNLKKILKFSDIINKTFEEIFWIKYDWLAWNDTSRIIHYINKNDYVFLNNINFSWPYSISKIFKNNFFISVEFFSKWSSYKEFFDVENYMIKKELSEKELLDLKIKFVKLISEKINFIWVISINNFNPKISFDFDFHTEKKEDFAKSYDFIAERKNNVLKFI